jgi:hypothetical protein
MTKQEQFLWLVQTSILANAVNMASSDDNRDRYRHEISATGVLITMDQALRASEMIPDRLTAGEAASEFCGYFLSNIRETEETTPQVPSWCARR